MSGFYMLFQLHSIMFPNVYSLIHNFEFRCQNRVPVAPKFGAKSCVSKIENGTTYIAQKNIGNPDFRTTLIIQ